MSSTPYTRSKLRHETLTSPRGVALRRKFPDGTAAIWCGREYGWRPWLTFASGGPEPKHYANKSSAKRALACILRHERELGLAGARYARL